MEWTSSPKSKCPIFRLPKSRTSPRPSRDGTPDMQSQLSNPMPVIYSNLSIQSVPTTERRGGESAATAALSPSKPQYTCGGQTVSTSRPAKLFAQLAAKAVAALETPKDLRPSRITCASHPEIGSPSSSRFPFFSRKKHANGTQVEKNKKEKKIFRNGSIAGTDHEDHGHIGASERCSGSISNMTRNSPVSQTTQEPRSGNDPFSADRMNPEAIAGAAIIENRNAVSEISQ
ncbi:hypothetical protein FANTH_14180 [Fusarium anthophilum]|uniref:Uncharacterized protein n=1 Tax=Fusarium anthophilum TaxID=48485 RepID=A0A8H5DMY3_9HYPO|nr:hypothetical protein FANTH_14180 [Fusarium anthophilum]